MNRRQFLRTVAQAAAIAGAAGVSRGAGAAPPRRISLMAVGDCILNRRISGLTDPDFIALRDLLREADCTWANCESVIADHRKVVPTAKSGDPHTLSPLWTAEEYAWMGIDLMGTANNHTLDYCDEGLYSTLEQLARAGIAASGSGVDLAAAARPAYFDCAAGRIADVNCSATFLPHFAAGPAHPYVHGRPGLNPLNYQPRVKVPRKLFDQLKKVEQRTFELSGWAEFLEYMDAFYGAIPEDIAYLLESQVQAADAIDLTADARQSDIDRITAAIRTARPSSRLVIASIHAHEARATLGQSAEFLPPFAHACIDAGADAYFSAGPHVLRGIEIYKGKPIFYCLGNFFFQYETATQVPAEAYLFTGFEADTLDPGPYHKRIFYNQMPRFWRAVAPRITYEEGEVVSIELFPLELGFNEPIYRRGTPMLARGEEAATILEQLAELSEPLGTTIEIDGEVGHVVL